MQRRIVSFLTIAMLLTAGLLLLLSLPGGSVAGATIYVSNTNPSTHITIQGAINAANDGDTIIVENGTYNEHLTFTTHSGYSELIIWGNGSVNIVGTTGNPTVNVDGGNVATLHLVNLTLWSDNTGEVEVYTRGTVNCVGTNVTKIAVDGTSILRHLNFITPTVYYLGGTETVDSAELKWSAGSPVKYASVY